MKNIKILLSAVIVVVALALSSGNAVAQEVITINSPPTPSQTPRVVDSVKDRIFMVPDSLLTKEEVELKYKFFDLVISHTFVENGQKTSTLTEQILIKNGIDPYYYKNIESDLKQQNEIIRLNVPSVEERNKILEDGIREYKEYRAKMLQSAK